MGGKRPLELLGKRYGRLIVIEQLPNKNGNTWWLCKCDCGNEKAVQGTRLVNGHTRSCGCLVTDVTVARNKQGFKYGIRGNRIYRIYWGMRTRCYNTTDHNYKRYGGRGIKICDEWLNSFEAFRDWSLANGYRDDLSIDRINNDGDYEPSNCRWATNEQQQANKTHPGSNHKPVRQLDLDGNVIAEYKSVNEAVRMTKVWCVRKCCVGEYKTAGGYKWEYIK